jgi:hypothetical protein
MTGPACIQIAEPVPTAVMVANPRRRVLSIEPATEAVRTGSEPTSVRRPSQHDPQQG